jgi:hypothetical protein
MWPSAETASLLYNLANIGLIVGLVIGVVSTIVVVWMGNVKEEYLDKALADSHERTALLEKQSGESLIAITKAKADAAQSLSTAKQAEANLAEANARAEEARAAAATANAQSNEAKAESAKSFERATEAQRHLADANERAAQAEQKAAEAKLALERFRAPRTLNPQEQQFIISNLRNFSGQEYTALLAPSGFDVRPLWIALNKILTQAGWSRVDPAGLASGDPPAGILIEPTPGITIAIDLDSYPKVGPAAEALTSALLQAHIDSRLAFGRDIKEKRLHVVTIIIGPKPQ